PEEDEDHEQRHPCTRTHTARKRREQQQQAEDEDLGIDREHGVLAARATPCRRAREVEWIPFERITANRAARTKTPRNPGVSTLKPAMVRRRPDAREG